MDGTATGSLTQSMDTTMNLTMNPLGESMRRMQGYEVTRKPEDAGLPNYQEGLFTYKGNKQTPWKTEQTHNFSYPTAYTARVLNGTIVHTGGNTEMAFTTHQTFERPMFPPGTIRKATYIKAQYIPTDDPALDELHAVAAVVAPQLPGLLHECASYHGHTPDGWITTAGFMTAAKRAGLTLSRAEYLALERALTKDTMGRINYLQLEQLVGSIAAADAAEEEAAE